MTPIRALTPVEQNTLQALRVVAANPVTLDQLLRELIVAREVIRTVRTQRRCLPRHAREALDHVPHHRPTAVEFPRD